MAAYYIIHCEPEKRFELLVHFVSSPNAIKEATMLITFLQGLGKDMLTNLVRDIIDGSESDAAKTNTAVQLAFLLDTKEGSFALPKVIELELSQHYTGDVLERYFSMDCSAVSQIVMWVPSITNMKYLQLMPKGNIDKVVLNKLDTGFVDDSDFTVTKQSAQTLRIKTLSFSGFGNLTLQDIAFLCSSTSENSQIVFTCNHSHIILTTNEECRKGDLGIVVEKMLVVQDDLFEVERLTPWFQSGFITSARCGYAETEFYLNLVNELGEMSSLTDLRLQKCPDVLGVPSVLLKNLDLKILHLTECQGSTYGYTRLATAINYLAQLKEFRICKATRSLNDNHKNKDAVDLPVSMNSVVKHGNFDTNQHILNPIIANLTEATQLEVLDLTDNVTEETLYRLLGDILPRLKHIRELRLGICDNPHALTDVCKGLKHTARLEILDMVRNTLSSFAYQQLGRNMFSALKVLKLGKCVALDACKPLLENMHKATLVTVLDLSRVLVSDEVCKHIAEQVKAMLNLRELYICKCETINAIQPFINNLEHTLEIESLDLSGNISNPEPYEVLDVRGRTTGNKVTSYVYQTLSERMTSLTKLRELRLCECDEPHGLIPVMGSLHHVTQLQTLDLSGNMADSKVLETLGEQLKHLVKLRVLRLCGSDRTNAVRHIIDKLHLVPELNILDISGLKAKFAKRGVLEELHNMSNTVDETVFQILGKQLQNLKELRELRLCGSKNVDSVKPVIKGLPHTPRLHTLDLMGNKVTNGVFIELGRQLSNLADLRELRLCYCGYHNAVGEIADYLRCAPSLILLDLTGTIVTGQGRKQMNVNYKNKASRVVFETLSCQLQHLSRLRELRVCMSRHDARGEGVAIADGLQYTPGLQVLQMGAWSLDAAGVQQLGDRLMNLREMRQLLLGDCDVCDMEDKQLYESNIYVQIHTAWSNCISRMWIHSHLQVLDLSFNNIGNESVVQLSRQLPSLTQLDILSMGRCGLTDTQAIIQLIDTLPSCPSLRILSVSGNHLGDGLEQIINMTRNLSQLFWLYLRYNKMSEPVLKNIKRQLKQKLPDLTLDV